MFLFLDTETTGLPRNWNAPASNTRNWPRLVQLAYLIFDADGQELSRANHIIRPEGFTIPSSAAKIHRITQEWAMEEGKPLLEVLDDLETALEQTKLVVAHNISFDEKVIGAEFYRRKRKDVLATKLSYCTMKSPEIVAYCALPPRKYGSYKWPTVSELHQKLFGAAVVDAHDALVDIEATAKCFWKLKEIEVI